MRGKAQTAKIGILIIILGGLLGDIVSAQSSRSKKRGVVSSVVLPNLNEILAPSQPVKKQADVSKATPYYHQQQKTQPVTSSVPTTAPFGDFDSDKEIQPLVQPDPPANIEPTPLPTPKSNPVPKVDAEVPQTEQKPTQQQQPIVIQVNPVSSCLQTYPIYRSYGFGFSNQIYYNNQFGFSQFGSRSGLSSFRGRSSIFGSSKGRAISCRRY